jgi:hypothetical protein
MLVSGIVLILIICICVKLFDDKIRPSHWLKVIVNTVTITGLLLIIVGLARIIIGW